MQICKIAFLQEYTAQRKIGACTMAKNRKTPDMNLPMWFDGQNINEALFCEEFLQKERRIIFANELFSRRWSSDGRSSSAWGDLRQAEILCRKQYPPEDH